MTRFLKRTFFAVYEYIQKGNYYLTQKTAVVVLRNLIR